MEALDSENSGMLTSRPIIYKGLSERQVEVLKWSAEGKTAAEVGIILGLKQRTVNFHVGVAIRKIGVSNKIQAVVKAALSGAF
jgi:LuxR family transcriptional regulator